MFENKFQVIPVVAKGQSKRLWGVDHETAKAVAQCAAQWTGDPFRVESCPTSESFAKPAIEEVFEP